MKKEEAGTETSNEEQEIKNTKIPSAQPGLRPRLFVARTPHATHSDIDPAHTSLRATKAIANTTYCGGGVCT